MTKNRETSKTAKRMSRSTGKPAGGGSETNRNDPFRPWTPKQRDLCFVLTFETRRDLVKVVELDGVETFQGSKAEKSWCLSANQTYANLDLDTCLVERVSCQPIGSPGSIVTTCPSVDVYFGNELLESSVRNAPCGGCPLYRGTSEDTTVHEWTLTPLEFDECKKFGNVTAENLAKHGAAIGRDGSTVTLPPFFAQMANEHLTKGVSQTERVSPTQVRTYSREIFDEKLKNNFLEAVSDVRYRFCNANEITVELKINPTCDLKNVNLDETVSVVVRARVWCEDKML